MYPAVVNVQPHGDFSLTVVFDDGVKGVLDMKPYLTFGVFKRISNIEEFQQVRIVFDTVEWPCGADLDPEFVRAKCRIVERT